MSFKKYIDEIKSRQKTSKPLIQQTRHKAGTTFDRGEAIKIANKVNERFIPPVDFSTASNFAFFGSAEDYYSKAIEHIRNDYPYDGTLTDKQLWHYSSSFLENYIFENEYPKTNGYVIFSSDGWGTQTATTGGYGLSSDPQYILFDGNLHIGNIVNDNLQFDSNLKFGQDTGNCVEFWIKKPGYVSSLTNNEVILDVWNSSSAASGIGKFSIQLNSDEPAPLWINIVSGTTDSATYITDIPSGSLIDNNWHHVALNVNYGASSTTVESYLDGVYQGIDSIAAAYNAVTGNFVATLGSLVCEQAESSGSGLGYGKLSASMDDFRFWRGTRTPRQIGIFSRQPVDGGAVTGSTNIDLGVYYKFNAGITTVASTDEVILDYSGRINNGTFVGYTSTARNIGSAFVDSGMATREVKDPILYKNHPLVESYTSEKKASGSLHDELNDNSFYHTLPDWITNEDQLNSRELKSLTQIMASVLDELFLEIKTFPLIHQMKYDNDRIAHSRFPQKALNSRGFLVGGILQDETANATMFNSGEKGVFVQKLEKVKKIIYSNLYNNSPEIFRTKGTPESLRNALRCFGVDNELINLSVYEDNSIIKLDDKRELYAEKFKFINFSTSSNNDAIVYPAESASIGASFISGTYGVSNPIEARVANTYECQVFLPKYPEFGGVTNVNFVGLSSSMFGVHGVDTTEDNESTTFLADDAGFQVYAVRDNLTSRRVKFVLTSSLATGGAGLFPTLTSELFDDSYDNETWTLGVTIKPSGYGVGDLNQALQAGSGSYVVNFRGYNVEDETVYNSFNLSASFHSERGIPLLSQNRKPYYGANRTNFTSSVITNSDLNIGFFRMWLDDLTDNELISHAKDPRNIGRDQPYENFVPLSSEFSGAYIPKINSLILNWGTGELTTSTAEGAFYLPDLSSGSYKNTAIQYFNEVLGNLYQAAGYGFEESSTGVYKSRFFTVGKTINPENFGELTGVRILTADDEITKSLIESEIGYFTIEKSAQQAINRDIISFFASLDGFNELIGNPINKYRMEYKDLKKLATEYFSTVISKRTAAAFFEYYKWLDNSINEMLLNLLPASLRGSDNVYNVIESHVLERNKYAYKLPTMEFRVPEPIAVASGTNPVDWKFAHHPLSNLQIDNCYWWKYEAERKNETFDSSLPAGVIYSRDMILSASKQTQDRKNASPIKQYVSMPKEIHGGINFTSNKRLDYYKGVIFNSSSEGFVAMAASESAMVDPQSCNDDLSLYTKRPMGGQIRVGDETNKFGFVAPLSLYSQSISTDTGSFANNTFNAANNNPFVTNIHHDVFGPDSDQPLQGPFTAQRVGGSKSRKIRLADDLTSSLTRPERFVVELDSANEITIQSPRRSLGYDAPVDQFYKDPPVRSPINIKNIQTTGSALGNFAKNYEVVQTCGKFYNNFHLEDYIDIPANLPSPYISGNYDYAVVTGTAGKTVFVERFSAPGGPDTAGAFLNATSGEYSVYNTLNNRNLVVRQAYNSLLKVPMSFGGYESGSNDLSASIHKVPANRRKRMKYAANGTTFTGTISDNGFISHGIPSNDRGYAWISASLLDYTGYGYNGGFTGSGINLAADLGFVTGSSELLFLSKSEVASALYGGARVWGFGNGYERLLAQPIFNDFVGLNTIIYEPLTDYTVGWSSFYVTPNASNFAYKFPGTYINFAKNPDNGKQSDLQPEYIWNAGVQSIWLGPGAVLNSLIQHRGGAYGYPSWKQVRVGQHPVARYWRKHNKIAQQNNSISIASPSDPFTAKETGFISAFEPAAVSDNSVLLVGDLQEDMTNNSTLFALAYNSQKTFFFDNALNSRLITKEQKQRRSSYEKFYDFYSSRFQDAMNKKDIQFVKFSHQIYPLQKYSYMGDSLNRDIFIQPWKDSLVERSILKDTSMAWDLNIPSGSKGLGPINPMGFAGLVYGNPNALSTQSCPFNLNSSTTDELRGNTVYASISVLDTATGSNTEIRNSVRLGRVSQSAQGTKYTDLRMTVDTGSSDYVVKLPYHESSGIRYAEYDTTAANNMRYGILRDPKSVLKRFLVHVPTRISGNTAYDGADTEQVLADSSSAAQRTHVYGPLLQMPYAVDDIGVGSVSGVFNTNFFDPWSAPTDYGKGPSYYNDHKQYREFVKICGKDHTMIPEYRISDHIESIYTGSALKLSSPQVSSVSITGSTAASTDISRFEQGGVFLNLEEIKKKHKFMKMSKLRLKIDAITKLLPYEGFYPAERTVQLANLYSSSLSAVCTLSSNTDEETFRTAMQPLFMPGILYNSIKAGIAMNHGMFRRAFSTTKVWTAGSENHAALGTDPGQELVISLSDDQFINLPFEELVTLENLKTNSIYDMYPHASMSRDCTASIDGDPKPFYQLAMSNFLASTIDFCLANNRLTTVISKEESELQSVKRGSSYAIEVALRGNVNDSGFVHSPWAINNASSLDYGLTGWGPSVSGSQTNAIGYRGTDALWKPSWGMGSASVILEWNPSQDITAPSIARIQSELTSTFHNAGSGSFIYSPAIQASIPNLSESLNYTLIADKTLLEQDVATGQTTKKIKPQNTLNNIWVIQPKWETPFLVRTDTTAVSDANATPGIWKSLCELPDPDTNGAEFSISFRDVAGKQSLKDYMRFPSKVDVGGISNSTVIEEALVCIPYYKPSTRNDAESFFTIPRPDLETELRKGALAIQNDEIPNEWYRLSRMLDKYVFPPRFDWKRNLGITFPQGMLIKEYSVALDKKDIQLFWQNLPPKPLGDFDQETAYLDIDLETTKMFKGIEDKKKIQWYIFKIKKRAKTNYFAMTAENPEFADFSIPSPVTVDGDKLRVEDFSYNYPYDFCSLLETAKITAEIDFIKKSDD